MANSLKFLQPRFRYFILVTSLLGSIIANPSLAAPLKNANCSFFERKNGEPESMPILEDRNCKIESSNGKVVIHWSDGVLTQVKFSSSSGSANVDGYVASVHQSEMICLTWNPSGRRGFEKTICYMHV